MLGQNLVEHFGIVMEGKSDVFYESVRFFLLNPVEAVEFFVDFIVIHAHVVQQIIIKIRNTCFSHLLVENRIARIADKIATIEASGTQILTLDDQTRADIREASQGVYESIKENIDPAIYKAYMDGIE